MIKEDEAQEARNNWIPTTNSEVKNKHKNRYGKIKTILSIWYFRRKRLPDGRLTKQKYRLCAHGGIQQWLVNCWEAYYPVVNWISVRSLLDIASIPKCPSRSIEFLLTFPQSDPDVYVLVDITLGMGVNGNIG